MKSPSARRRAVKLVVETGMDTTTDACRALGLARSSYYRNRIVSAASRMKRKQIENLIRTPLGHRHFMSDHFFKNKPYRRLSC